MASSKNISSKSTSINFGYFVLQKIYSDLNIKSFLNKITSDKKIKFNINDINRFLICYHILNIKNELATINNLDFFMKSHLFLIKMY